MKKTLIFLTVFLFTVSAFATNNNNVASFTEWMQINGYTPSFPDDPGDIIEQWAAPNGSPMEIDWDPDGDFIWHVSENEGADCIYQIEVATPHSVLASYPCPNPYGIPAGGSMNGACVGNGFFYYTDFNGDLTVVDDHIVQVDRTTLAAIDQWEVDPDIDQVLGITYKAPYFYVVCNSTGLIYEVDLQPGGVYSIISTITAPGGGPVSGIHYLEGNDTFWIASFLGGVVYETDSSFNILQTIPAPAGANAIGITWPGEGENYWLTDFGNDQFYIIDGDIVVSTTVDFTIDLTDDYGDGWNGGTLDLLVNGTVVLDDITVVSGYGPETFVFSVANGDFVEIYFTPGGWAYECAYYVYDNLGNLVVSSGDGGVEPDAYVSFTAIVGAADATLEGYVYEFGTGTPIEGAVVTIAGIGLNATTLADGSYSIIDIVPNVYDISCDAPLYITAEELGFDIVSGTNTLDFDLLWSEIEASVTELVSNLPPDETEVQTFTIINNGPGELVYDISLDLPAEVRVRNGSSNHPVSNSRESTKTSKNMSNVRNDSSINDRDPRASNNSHGIPATDDLFDLQFDWPVGVGGGEAGIETDGTYMYTTKWNGGTFFRYAMDGTYIEEFSVTGCPGNIRDLAYDGTYFYGASATNTVYEMDFDTQTVISTISAPIAVRAIAYDGASDGFWANNWSDTITLFDRSGATLNSFPCGVFQSYYGFAWENVLPGGPFLWGYSQDGPTLNQLVQFDIATGLETGVNFDIGSICAVGTGIAGGVCISDAFVPGKWTICGTSQNVNIWGVELADAVSWVMVTNNISGTVPGNGGSIVVDVTFDATGLTIGDVLTGELLIHNNSNYIATRGDDYVIPLTLNVGGTTLEVPTNVSVDPDLGLLTWGPPAGVAIYSDDFESYNVGEYLAVQSADWTTWSNAPGGAEDALISDAQALSGSNSVVVEGSTDLVLIMNDYTSGVYSMDLNLFVPTGYCGYWNLQKTSTPGQEWAFQIQFDVTGIATADAGAAAALTFPFSFDTWINMELIVDLDADWCEIWVDGVMLHEYQWTLGTFGTPGLLQFGGMNLYAWASAGNSPMCYFDDITLQEVTSDTRDLIGYNVYLDDMGTVLANVGDDVFEYLYSGLVYNQAYIAGVSAVYDAGESDIVEFPFTYTGVSAGNIVNITTALKGNYPNPFNPVTNIAFSLGEATHVTLEVYNIKGEKVRTLVNKVLAAKDHVITWDGKNNTNKSVASGIYFYKMKAEKYTATKKMILMK